MIVAGPTASGKSAAAVAVASAYDGTVINADSMQIYRELPILTAQPDAAEARRVPHRLYGAVSAGEPFSVGDWRARAVAEIDAAAAIGRLPILCGGTGLYLQSLIEGLADIPGIPDDIRAAAAARYDALGPDAFHAALAARDPVMAGRLRPTDRQRLCRAWAVLEATGRSLADWQAETPKSSEDYRFGVIVFDPPREALRTACDARFDAMMAAGALEEVRALATMAPDPQLPAMKALGVPHLLAHLRGDLSLEEAIGKAKTATRQYVKRQQTYFRHRLAADLTLNEQYSESLDEKIFSFIRRFLLTPAD